MYWCCPSCVSDLPLEAQHVHCFVRANPLYHFLNLTAFAFIVTGRCAAALSFSCA